MKRCDLKFNDFEGFEDFLFSKQDKRLSREFQLEEFDLHTKPNIVSAKSIFNNCFACTYSLECKSCPITMWDATGFLFLNFRWKKNFRICEG